MNESDRPPKTTAASGKKAVATRSRAGCTECRRLRRKCSEGRPACESCTAANKTCSYNHPLRWGGRTFKKSAFGQIVGDGVGIIVQETPSRSPARVNDGAAFVYGTAATSKNGQETRSSISTTPRSTIDTTETSADEEAISSTISLAVRTPIENANWLPFDFAQPAPQINWLSWLGTHHRYLIHHFIHGLTKCISLHPAMHREFCTVLVPLALDKNHGIHLLSACLVASARHRKALGHVSDDTQTDRLAAISISNLARQQIGNNTKINEVAAATALVLCMAEIQAGGIQPGTWKIHLRGAKAILAMQDVDEAPSPTLRLLRRWCQSLDILSLSASRPEGVSQLLNNPKPGHIDMFEGFSTALIPIFQEMADLARNGMAIHALEAASSSPDAIRMLRDSMTDRSWRLDYEMGLMAKRPCAVLDLSLNPVAGSTADFQALNEVYHHSARLELRHNVLLLPIGHPETNQIVKDGIACLKRMALEMSAPACKTLHCAFSIGCAAHDAEDREFIASWMDKLNQSFAMGNVIHAKAILVEYWTRCDNGQPNIRPRLLAYKKGWELILH